MFKKEKLTPKQQASINAENKASYINIIVKYVVAFIIRSSIANLYLKAAIITGQGTMLTPIISKFVEFKSDINRVGIAVYNYIFGKIINWI